MNIIWKSLTQFFYTVCELFTSFQEKNMHYKTIPSFFAGARVTILVLFRYPLIMPVVPQDSTPEVARIIDFFSQIYSFIISHI